MKGLGLALACFSDVGRDGMDKSVPSIWSKHSASKGLGMAFTSQVQVLIAPQKAEGKQKKHGLYK